MYIADMNADWEIMRVFQVVRSSYVCPWNEVLSRLWERHERTHINFEIEIHLKTMEEEYARHNATMDEEYTRRNAMMERNLTQLRLELVSTKYSHNELK